MTKTRNLADLGGGFIQAGTGAVQRTVESKLQDVVSVKDFGAVGDGVADDTAAIQAAINSPATTILIPQGSYLISAAISINSGKTLRGYGREVTSIVVSGGAPSFNALLVKNDSTLADLTVNLNDKASSTGVFLDNASRASVLNVRSINCGFHGIALTNGARYNRIFDCETSGNGHRGVILSAADYNQVRNLRSFDNDLAGLLIYNGNHNIIHSLSIESINNNGIWVHMDSHYNILKGVTVTNPVQTSSAGLYVGGNASHNIFSEFVFSGSDRAVLVRGSSVDPGLTDGDTRENVFSCFQIRGRGSGIAGSTGVKFESFSGGFKAAKNKFSDIVFADLENGFNWTNSAATDTLQNYISDCHALDNVTYPWRFGSTTPGGGGNRINNLAGYTPAGALALDPAAPAIPADTVPVANPYPFSVMINISGLTGNYLINDTNSGLPDNLGNYTLILAAGQTITLNYSSGTPAWRWWGI